MRRNRPSPHSRTGASSTSSVYSSHRIVPVHLHPAACLALRVHVSLCRQSGADGIHSLRGACMRARRPLARSLLRSASEIHRPRLCQACVRTARACRSPAHVLVLKISGPGFRSRSPLLLSRLCFAVHLHDSVRSYIDTLLQTGTRNTLSLHIAARTSPQHRPYDLQRIHQQRRSVLNAPFTIPSPNLGHSPAETHLGTRISGVSYSRSHPHLPRTPTLGGVHAYLGDPERLRRSALERCLSSPPHYDLASRMPLEIPPPALPRYFQTKAFCALSRRRSPPRRRHDIYTRVAATSYAGARTPLRGSLCYFPSIIAHTRSYSYLLHPSIIFLISLNRAPGRHAARPDGDRRRISRALGARVHTLARTREPCCFKEKIWSLRPYPQCAALCEPRYVCVLCSVRRSRLSSHGRAGASPTGRSAQCTFAHACARPA